MSEVGTDGTRAEGYEVLRDMNGEQIVHDGRVYCVETDGECPGRIVLRRVGNA